MGALISSAIVLFAKILQIVLFVYIIVSFLPVADSIKQALYYLVAPIVEGVGYLLNHSIIKSTYVDFSPFIGILLLSSIEFFFR